MSIRTALLIVVFSLSLFGYAAADLGDSFRGLIHARAEIINSY